MCHTERQGLSFQPPALGLLTHLNKPAVEAVLGHQRIVSPLLNDPSLVHHHDLIRVPNGGEPVGDGNESCARRQLPDGGQKQVFVLRIHAGSRLIQNHGAYIYLKENDFAVSEQTAQDGYIFPSRLYQGIKIYFDIEQLSQNAQELMSAFELDFTLLRENYFRRQKTYINEADSELTAIFRKLWALSEQPSLFYLRICTLELIYELLHTEPRPSKTCGFYTELQVGIAKKAEQILTADLRKHIPVRLLAEKFSVGETSLKNYFRGVYGQNISTYLREARMKAAAEFLTDTNRPIAEIAEQVSYSNQGKFAAVFKKQFGMSPLEYRRAQKLATL